jgi:MFS-type transporter involved in bile tolerance (Atg22 family)
MFAHQTVGCYYTALAIAQHNYSIFVHLLVSFVELFDDVTDSSLASCAVILFMVLFSVGGFVFLQVLKPKPQTTVTKRKDQ